MLFQKSWEEKKETRKKASRPLSYDHLLYTPCRMGYLSSTSPAALQEGGKVLTLHNGRNTGC